MKRVLIITYYWPPSGGAGVQRWLYFTKYLREFGYEPVIYTAENPEYPSIDHSFEKEIPDGIEILKTPIKEPYGIYKKLVGKKKDEKINSSFLSEKKKPGPMEQFARFVRGNFFIPDARKGWIKPSIKYLTAYLQENPVDLIISTGPPHSMHMIALGLKRNTGIKWLADFRDPWTGIDFYNELKLTRWADARHHRLEKEVLQTADIVTTVGPTLAKELEAIREASVEVIYNGFEPVKQAEVPTDRFVISHIGSLVPARNPKALWKVLGEMVAADEAFRDKLLIRLVGKVDVSAKEAIEKAGLMDNLEHIPYVEHEEAVRYQCTSTVLLLLINDSPNAKGVLTGKVFEYLASGRPILCIGPVDGDAAEVIQSSKSGTVVDFKDDSGIKLFLDQFKANQNFERNKDSGDEVLVYSRKSLTKRLVELMDE